MDTFIQRAGYRRTLGDIEHTARFYGDTGAYRRASLLDPCKIAEENMEGKY